MNVRGHAATTALRPRERASSALSRSTALTRMERLAAVTHLVASLEFLARPGDRRPGGLHNWEIAGRGFRSRWGVLGRVVDGVARPAVTDALHLGRCVAALALLAPSSRRSRLAADAALSATSIVLAPRHRYGRDAPDQVAFFVQAVSAVARAAERRPRVMDACLWYVALQCVLSYTASGWVKLAGRSWRAGDALEGVSRTLTFGDPAAWRLFHRHPGVGRLLGPGVIAMECSFPMVFVGRGRMAAPMLWLATSFHLAIARIMGLDRFVWAFLSMHPAVLYAAGPRARHNRRGRVVARRDDTLPRACGALLVTAWACALLAQRRRHRQVLAGRGDEQAVTTSAGCTLALRRRGPPGGKGPVIVLVSGLLATVEHWEWIADALGQRFSTVTYSRAGYGPSRYAGGPFRLATAVQDLAELVEHVAEGRRVVLVGHGMGGHLALRAAARPSGPVAGLVLLDWRHPAELQHPAAPVEGRQELTGRLSLMPRSLSAGFGVLLERPTWVDSLPAEVRGSALAQYRDSRLWAAGQREWRAALQEAAGRELSPIAVPLLLLTPEDSAAREDLGDGPAGGAPCAQHHVVAGADHDALLVEARPARRVAALITGFVGDAVVDGTLQQEAAAHASAAH
jgi:pimeloyl-ACP methyl ester carboxylesterase